MLSQWCEHGQELTDAPTWVVDPIDGTTNFIHRQVCALPEAIGGHCAGRMLCADWPRGAEACCHGRVLHPKDG